MAKIKNIIFDFGGVLVDLDKERSMQRFAALGIDVRSHIRDYVQGGPFALLESGQSTEDEFLRALRQLSSTPEKATDEALKEAWNSMLVRIPLRRLHALQHLKTRYRVFLLSNTNSIHWDYSVKSLFSLGSQRVDNLFEKIYLSYELQLMKPGKEIFEKVLADAGLEAEETLFIDDSQANCQAAISLGIHTFCPEEADDWMPLFI